MVVIKDSSRLFSVKFLALVLLAVCMLTGSFVISGNIDNSTSQNEFAGPDVLNISPVHFKDHLIVSSTWEGELFNVKLLNSNGNVVIDNNMMTIMDSKLFVNTSNLPAGEYFVSLSAENQLIGKTVYKD